MSNRTITSICAAVAVGLTISVGALSQTSSSASKTPPKTADSDIQKIVLPQYPPDIPNGPNVEIYRKDCLICHTARYVSMQPRFSKTVWQSEVKKMVDAYGAPVSEADQALIVDYLVAVKGVPTSPDPAPSSK